MSDQLSNKIVRKHLKEMRSRLGNNALKLALYIYEQTILLGKQETEPLGYDELAEVLDCSADGAQDVFEQLSEGGYLDGMEAQIGKHKKRYRLSDALLDPAKRKRMHFAPPPPRKLNV